MGEGEPAARLRDRHIAHLRGVEVTDLELVSAFWCGVGVLALIGVLYAQIRAGLDEQRKQDQNQTPKGKGWRDE